MNTMHMGHKDIIDSILLKADNPAGRQTEVIVILIE